MRRLRGAWAASVTYEQILTRLSEIEDDLAERQDDYEQAADDYHRAVRDFELRVARVKISTDAGTETAKKDKALDAIAAAEDDLYDRLKDAEARYSAEKAAVKVLEIRATIGMSLLKQFARESGSQGGTQPQWTGARAA